MSTFIQQKASTESNFVNEKYLLYISNCMDKKEIGIKLKDLGISPSLLCWGDDVVCCTKIWYDEDTNRMCSDCGVSVPVGKSLDVAQIMISIEDAVISYYRQQGVVLQSSFV